MKRPTRVLLVALFALEPVAAAVSRSSGDERKSRHGHGVATAAPAHRYYDTPPQLPVWACRTAYAFSAVNPAISVFANEYKGVRPLLPARESRKVATNAPLTAVAVRSIFYFARLKPRLLFVMGSVLRALQLTTVVHYVFDPSIGVGAGLNMLALLCSSQWPAPLLLGWALSKPVWLALRAQAPQQSYRVPISVFGTSWTGRSKQKPS